VYAENIHDLLEILAAGHEKPALVDQWGDYKEPHEEVDDTRALLKKEFGIDPPKDARLIVERATKAHPDLTAWLADWRAGRGKKATPSTAKRAALATPSTPGTMKLAKIAKHLPKGQAIPTELVKLFEFAKACGTFFSGSFEVSEDSQDDAVAWFSGNAKAASEFVVFGHDRAQSLYALWLEDKDVSKAPVVHLGSEGEAAVLAENARDFLMLLAVGSGEVGLLSSDDASEADEGTDIDSFRTWLKKEFEIAAPYASDDYRRALASHAMLASMSRTGDCWDNAVAESFFATLRAELVDDERYPTRRSAEASIGEYIDAFYNVERLHSHLDYVSPIEFELKEHVAAIAA
jgi:hypothetical protein